jgi:hypothetical protein
MAEGAAAIHLVSIDSADRSVRPLCALPRWMLVYRATHGGRIIHSNPCVSINALVYSLSCVQQPNHPGLRGALKRPSQLSQTVPMSCMCVCVCVCMFTCGRIHRNQLAAAHIPLISSYQS